jgi:hypothetical protein
MEDTAKQPAQSVAPAAVTEQPRPAAPTQEQSGKPLEKTKKPRGKWLMPVVLVGALVFAGAAVAYQAVFNQSPQLLFESALTNTSKVLDEFLKIDQQEKGLKVDGSFDVTSPLAVDGTLSGHWDESNGSLISNVGAVGIRVTSEVRTIDAENSDVPDIYFKLGGLTGVDVLIRSLAGPEYSQAADVIKSLDEQWYVIDHTLIEQAVQAGAGTPSYNVPELSEKDMRAISDAVAGVMRDRFFGSEEDKAVFKINDTIGKEDFEGTGSYKLNVGVDKDNFISFLESFESVIKDTKLNDVFEMGAQGQNIDELLDFSSISESLKDVDFSKATADVWVEGNGRFIRNVRIYPSEDKKDTNYLDFMVPYAGGDVIPLVMRATIDEEDVKGVLSFGIDINQENGDLGLWFDIDLTTSGATVAVTAKLAFTGSDDQVSVDKPESAKSAAELVNQLTDSVRSFSPLGQLPIGGLDDFELPLDDFQL